MMYLMPQERWTQHFPTHKDAEDAWWSESLRADSLAGYALALEERLYQQTTITRDELDALRKGHAVSASDIEYHDIDDIPW